MRFQDDLLPELTNENTRFAIRKLAYKHLYNYYQTFTTNHLTWDELVNLPPGYAVKASDVAYLSGHNQVKGIHPVEHDGEKAVIVLCTIGGDNYANEWLTDDRRRLKYYLEGRTDRNSGRRKYDPELPTNKAVINSRKDNYSVHVFAREKKGELFHYAGPFVFDQMGTDTSGDKYFILQRKEGKERGNGAVDTGVAGMPSLVNSIYTYVRKKGFVFSWELLANLFLSLKTKPFVILAGISGTGKTKLIELFAEAVGATSDNGRFELIPVRPDWNDSTDLLGYKNLEGKFQPGVLTRVIQRALSDGNNPYFVCLDEMNLARVEYYFSDLLSLLETRRWSGDRIRTSRIFRDSDFVLPEDREEFADLHIPDNLYFVGTVNMDETTHPFSKKVLDRANTIEIVDVTLDNYGEEQSGGGQAGAPEIVTILNSDLRSKYCFLQECLPEYRPIVDSVVGYLIEINDILQEANLHVGYRVRDEICFYMIYNSTFGLMDEDKAFDWQLCQKILPRIQGSSQKIMDILRSLFSFVLVFLWLIPWMLPPKQIRFWPQWKQNGPGVRKKLLACWGGLKRMVLHLSGHRQYELLVVETEEFVLTIKGRPIHPTVDSLSLHRDSAGQWVKAEITIDCPIDYKAWAFDPFVEGLRRTVRARDLVFPCFLRIRPMRWSLKIKVQRVCVFFMRTGIYGKQ